MKNEEMIEQMAFLEWCHLKNIAVMATPNETPAGSMRNGVWTKNWKSINEAKAKGVSSGFPDLTVLVPCGDGRTRLVFIEMKKPSERPKKDMDFWEMQKHLSDRVNWIGKMGGMPKKTLHGVKFSQMEWNEKLNMCEEAGAYFCYGADEAVFLVEYFMELYFY